MADDFDLFESDLFAQPTEAPSEEAPLAPAMDVPLEPEAPRRDPSRRRKRKRHPKWQRLLWKYWPPIRFGLIILAGILLIWLAISSISGLLAPEPTEPEPPVNTTEATDPPETTLPPETTEPEETTEPPTVDPASMAVPESWYENALFIGDFGYAGLKSSSRMAGADYFTGSNLGVFNYTTQTASDQNYEKQDLATVLASRTYDKILINLGINNCGYSTSSLVSAYSGLIAYLQEAQPNAKIIIQAILPVTSEYAKRAEYFSVDHIENVNSQLQGLADGTNVFFVSVNGYMTETNGYLNPSVSTDGCHLTSSACADMAKFLSIELGQLRIH